MIIGINCAVAAVFLFFFLASILFALSVGWLVYLALIASVGVLSYLGIKRTFVELKDNGIQIKQGIIRKSQALFLFSEMQDVTESQGLLEMIIGLKSISIKTMTYSSAALGTVGGLRAEDAQAIRNYALENIENSANVKGKLKSSKEPAKPEDEKEMAENPWPLHFYKPTAAYLAFAVAISVFAGIAILFGQAAIAALIIFAVWIGFAIALAGSITLAISYNYFMGKTRLNITQGILSFRRESIPFSKIQDIVLRRSVFHHLIGLGDIVVETGEAQVYTGSSQKGILGNTIPCLEMKDAFAIRKTIFDYLGISLLSEKKAPLSESFGLEKAKILKESLRVIIALGIILLLAAGFCAIQNSASSFNLLWIATAAIVGIIFPLTFIFNYFYWKSYYYDFLEEAIMVRKGVLGVNEVIVPFERVQNIFVDQDIIDRMLGLYDLHFSTVAWHSSFLCHIDGLSLENAERLKELLKNRIAK